MKTCSKCNAEKPLEAFTKRSKKRKDGTKHYYFGAVCKCCTSVRQLAWAHRTNQKEKRKPYFDAYNKTDIANSRKSQWKQEHKNENAEINRKWRQARPDKQKQYAKNYAKRYPHKIAAINAARRAWRLRARPAWSDLAKIREIYKEAEFLSKVMGVRYSVDHIIPLKGKNVCGLHVENNLRVIPFSENCRKYNLVLEEFA